MNKKRTQTHDGYIPLTVPYKYTERKLMMKATAELERSGIDYRTVETKSGTEIWRTLKGYHKAETHKKKPQFTGEAMP